MTREEKLQLIAETDKANQNVKANQATYDEIAQIEGSTVHNIDIDKHGVDLEVTINDQEFTFVDAFKFMPQIFEVLKTTTTGLIAQTQAEIDQAIVDLETPTT